MQKYNNYICPACHFYNDIVSLSGSKYLQCNSCSSKLLKSKDSEFGLRKAFSYHSKIGYKCNFCNKFIPQPINGSANIVCPYPNCSFVGSASMLKTMRHPRANVENIDQKTNNSFVKQTILDLKNRLIYECIPSTLFHKNSVYDAIISLIDESPEEITQYLYGNSNKYLGLQSKIFQRYIKSIEAQLPIHYTKYNKWIKISSLLDEELGIFSGISAFQSNINNNLVIKNGTKEFYIGKRKGSIVRNYYIGKLLDIKENNKSIISDVEDYTFNLIKLRKGVPGTIVTVTHMMVVPHYEMGGMVYVNQILRKIMKEIKNEHITNC